MLNSSEYWLLHLPRSLRQNLHTSSASKNRLHSFLTSHHRNFPSNAPRWIGIFRGFVGVGNLVFKAWLRATPLPEIELLRISLQPEEYFYLWFNKAYCPVMEFPSYPHIVQNFTFDATSSSWRGPPKRNDQSVRSEEPSNFPYHKTLPESTRSAWSKAPPQSRQPQPNLSQHSRTRFSQHMAAPHSQSASWLHFP